VCEPSLPSPQIQPDALEVRLDEQAAQSDVLSVLARCLRQLRDGGQAEAQATVAVERGGAD
jgi:hypothetical protein